MPRARWPIIMNRTQGCQAKLVVSSRCSVSKHTRPEFFLSIRHMHVGVETTLRQRLLLLPSSSAATPNNSETHDDNLCPCPTSQASGTLTCDCDRDPHPQCCTWRLCGTFVRTKLVLWEHIQTSWCAVPSTWLCMQRELV